MDRKGIGKLSLFSIAHSMKVHTVKKGANPVPSDRSLYHNPWTKNTLPGVRSKFQKQLCCPLDRNTQG